MRIADIFPDAGITPCNCGHDESAGMIANGCTRAMGYVSTMIAQNGPCTIDFVTAAKPASGNHTPLLLRVMPQDTDMVIGQGGRQDVKQICRMGRPPCQTHDRGHRRD